MLKSSQAQKFLNKNNFYDKDLGWLHFNKRVLELCQDSQFTDAERLNFYNIFFSNLSEFFMKRLARRIRPGQVPLGSSSLLLNQKSKVIIEEVQKLRVLARRLYRQEINPILLRNGVELLHWKDVRSKEKDFLHNYFQNSIYPALTPITVSKNAPFPLISNMSISLAIKAYKKNKKTPLFTRIKIPSFTPYWIRCSDESSGHFRFVRICNLIEEFIEDVLPGLTKAQISNFRIIRSLEVDEKEDEEADDMLHLSLIHI